MERSLDTEKWKWCLQLPARRISGEYGKTPAALGCLFHRAAVSGDAKALMKRKIVPIDIDDEGYTVRVGGKPGPDPPACTHVTTECADYAPPNRDRKKEIGLTPGGNVGADGCSPSQEWNPGFDNNLEEDVLASL